jgi:hypothetical protein
MRSRSTSNGDGSPSKSILEALNETSDSKDCDKGYDSKEYDVAMKEFEAELALEELEKNKPPPSRYSSPTREMTEAKQLPIHQRTHKPLERRMIHLLPPLRPMMNCQRYMVDQGQRS